MTHSRIIRHITFATVSVLLSGILVSCDRDVPLISSGLDDTYTVARMQKLILSTPLPGECRWICTLPDGTSSVISHTDKAVFVAATEGLYHLTLEITDAGGQTAAWESGITVTHEEVEYSPYISEVTDYRPAPGQFVNIMPIWEEGDDAQAMCRKAEEAIGGTMDNLISLGSYGGYVVFRFDHTIVNRPGKPDFRIWGNAFYGEGDESIEAGSSEPGIVMVALDSNGNDIADPEEWYELRGSEYDSPLTRHNYSITYYPPEEGKAPVPVRPFITDAEYIRWTGSDNTSGFVAKNNQHRQDYFPNWLPKEPMRFEGLSQLAPNAEDVYGNGLYFRFYSYKWGYADNRPNDDAEANSFDISNAVDRFGVPVSLPGADFIKVYTGICQYCGRLGETSTEISRAADLSLYEPETGPKADDSKHADTLHIK